VSQVGVSGAVFESQNGHSTFLVGCGNGMCGLGGVILTLSKIAIV
jgi:hypothetical protein